jgi:hypothetical protein
MLTKETKLDLVTMMVKNALQDKEVSLFDIERAVGDGIEEAGQGSYYVDIHK